MMTAAQRAERLKLVKASAKKMQFKLKMVALKRQYWEERRKKFGAVQDEPKDTTIESAGNADYDIQELPDLVLG